MTETKASNDPTEAPVALWRQIVRGIAKDIHAAKNLPYPDGSPRPGAEPWPDGDCPECMAQAAEAYRLAVRHLVKNGYNLTTNPPTESQIIGGMAAVTDLDRMKGLPWCYRQAFQRMVDLAVVPVPPMKPEPAP